MEQNKGNQIPVEQAEREDASIERLEARLDQVLATIEERNRAIAQDALQDAIRDIQGLPDRSRLAEISDGAQVESTNRGLPVSAFGAARVRPGWEGYYRTLRDDMPGRRWRTPEYDVLCARWLIAMRDKDRATLREIGDENVKMRAILLEGAADAGGGIAAGSGGDLVPLPFEAGLLEILQAEAVWRQIAAVVTTNAQTLRWPVQNVLSAVTWEAENATIDENTFATDFVLFIKRKMGNISQVSNELLEDSPFNIMQFITADVGRAMAVAEDTAFSAESATTNGPSSGLVEAEATPTNETALADGGTPGALTYPDLVTLYFACPTAYRANASWVCGDAVAQIMSELTANGRPILFGANDLPGVLGREGASPVGRIFNKPVWVPAGFPSDRLYFGDMSRTYGILDGGGIRAAVSEHAGFAVDATHLRFTRRVDGNVIGNATGARETYAYFDGITT